MARPKEYDRQAVIDAATELFWKKGFHGTSLNELVTATRLNKQSMYQEFGSKAGLFDVCLDNFRSIMGKRIIRTLTREPVCIDNIRALFHLQAEFIASPDFKGCLFINSVNEREHLRENTLKLVDSFFGRLEKLFYDCLRCSFNESVAVVRAQYLVNLFVGIMTVGKVKFDPVEHELMLKVALAVLGDEYT